jgi:ligand-binding sensor protein
MQVWEMRSEREWQEILDRVSEEFGVHTILGDAEGRILLKGGQYPSLCARVRKNPEALTFVCSQTNSRMFRIAKDSGKPCNDFCEIGLFKTVVPIFFERRFLGGLSACGVRLMDEPVEEFLVAKVLDMEETEVKELVEAVPSLEALQAERIAESFSRALP